MADFEIVAVNDLSIVLIDLDRGRSVTNDATRVIEELQRRVAGGIGRRSVYYRDTMGRFDRLLVGDDGQFDGFAPCSEGQQQMLRQWLREGDRCGRFYNG
jgi:hypothetical protein